MKKYFLILVILILGIFVWYSSNDESQLNENNLNSDVPLKLINSTYYKDFNLSNKFVIYVDFNKPRTKKRLWVINKGRVIATSYTSHGRQSASFSNSIPKRFSNRMGSNKSSLGIYRIYPQRKMNPGKVHSCTCKDYFKNKKCNHNARKFPINGLESSNDNALNRGIVIHTSHYVSERGCRGNSDGCFVVSPEVFELIQTKRYLLLNKCYLLALN